MQVCTNTKLESWKAGISLDAQAAACMQPMDANEAHASPPILKPPFHSRLPHVITGTMQAERA